MKPKALLIPIFLLCIQNALFAQAGNLKSCLARTRLFTETYNAGRYEQFYRLMDSSLQSKIGLTRFRSFLDDSLKRHYGQIMGLDHLEQTTTSQIFILRFQRGQAKLSIALDPYDYISSFEINPLQTNEVILKKPSALHNNPLLSKIDSVVHQAAMPYMELAQTCGLSIGILVNGIQISYHYGEQSKGSRTLPNDSSVYEAGSITKTFTGLVLAHAILDKEMDSLDDIRRYLPGRLPNLAYGNTPITPMHLVNHSSGLPRLPSNLFQQVGFDTLNPYKQYTSDMLMQDLKGQVIERPPGQEIIYSNYGMAVLGKCLERAYKKTYTELVKEKIIMPLGMKHSCLRQEDAKAVLQGYAASGKATPHWDLNLFAPAGALLTSVNDMLRFLQYQINEEDKACRLSHKVTLNKSETYAMGWQIENKRLGGNVYWHNGATFGFTSFCAFSPRNKIAIVLLSNAAASVDHIAIRILKSLSNSQ